MGTDGTIHSGERMFDIIEALQSHTSAGVTELAEITGMPKSTVHVYLSTLKGQGFVVQDDTQQYRLSLKFLDVGMMVRETQEMYDQVVPKLDELAAETEEKVWWIVEENGKAVFLAKSLGAHAIQTTARIGQHAELYELAGGMAILSALPENRQRTILDGYEYPLPDGRTLADLEGQLDDIRERGISAQSEQFLQGVTGVGAPLKDNYGNVYGAISVSGPAGRLDEDRIENELSPLVLGVSGELQVNLSYQ